MNYLHILILLCLTISTGNCTFRKLKKLYSGVESFFDIFNFDKKGPHHHHRHRHHHQQHPHGAKHHHQKGHKYLAALPPFLPPFEPFYEGGFGHDYGAHHSDYGYFFDGHGDYDYEHEY